MQFNKSGTAFGRTRITLFVPLIIIASMSFAGCETKSEKNVSSNGYGLISLPEKIEEIEGESKYSFCESDMNIRDYLVGEKIKRMGLEPVGETFSNPVGEASELYKSILDSRNDIEYLEIVKLDDNTSEGLQKCIDENQGKLICVTAETISVDKEIMIPSDTYLIGSNTKLIAMNGINSVFKGVGVDNIHIEGFAITGDAEYGCYFVDSNKVEIVSCDIYDLAEKPILILGESKGNLILNNTCEANWEGGLYLAGNVSDSLIYQNTITENYGASNWMAGITLSRGIDNSYEDIWADFDETKFFNTATDLDGKGDYPHDLIILDNTVSLNQSGGIYFDGAYDIYAIGNTVEDNEKEGTCLDFGTFGCFLYKNTYSGNGNRNHQNDTTLLMDEVLDDGRLLDGSAKAKLPGISLDNAAFNIIDENVVADNAGTGIKMVRASLYNILINNEVKDNNNGTNSTHHFFGIELGGEKDASMDLLMNFGPDYGNLVLGNTVSGAHYSGIFIGEGGADNQILSNEISGVSNYSIESISKEENRFEDNEISKTNRIL